MIHVLHLITGLGVGGAERALEALIQAKNGSSICHRVVSMTDIGPVGAELASAGVSVQALEMRRGSPSPLALLRLVKTLRRSKPDILHCWMYHANLLGLVGGRLARVPHIVWAVHSANEKLSGWRPLTRLVARLSAWLSRYPEIIVSAAESGKRVHAVWGYDTSKMVIIHNGYDLDKFRPSLEARDKVRRELGLSPDTLLVGMIARYDPAKDFRNFFQAASMLVERHSGVHFVMAGTAVSANNLELSRPIHELGLTAHFHLLGRRDDVPILSAALDVACLSSATEAFPNAVGEAMACGVPCVVTDVGDAALIVGDTGRVVPPKDPVALARGLAEMIDLGPGGRGLLGQSARKRVEERFSLARMVEAYESLYQSLMG